MTLTAKLLQMRHPEGLSTGPNHILHNWPKKEIHSTIIPAVERNILENTKSLAVEKHTVYWPTKSLNTTL